MLCIEDMDRFSKEDNIAINSPPSDALSYFDLIEKLFTMKCKEITELSLKIFNLLTRSVVK